MVRWKVALGVSGGAFILLAILVMGTHSMAFEHFWADPLRADRGPALDSLMAGLTWLGDGWLLAALCMALLLFLKDRWERRALALVYVAQLVGNNVLKEIIRRARPGDEFDPLVHPHFFSFPSGHTMAATAVWGFLAWLMARGGHPRWGLALLLIPPVVGLTRVYLGAHYPTDVLGGFFAGIVVIALVQLTRPTEGSLHGDRHWPLGQ